MKTRNYHVLFGKEDRNSSWEMLFGDYSFQVVQSEYSHERQSGRLMFLKVFTLETDTEAAIIDKLKELNK